MNKLKKRGLFAAMLGSLLALSIGSAAQAGTVSRTVDLGVLGTAAIGDSFSVGMNGLATGDSFIDTYVFDIASPQAFTVASALEIDIANLLRLTGMTASFLDAAGTVITNSFIPTSTTTNGVTVNSIYLDKILPAGNDYRLVIAGTIAGTAGGSYGGVLQTTPDLGINATPVPEASNYLLMLAGLALLAPLSRRRRGLTA
jgi:hypothetical protein